MTQPKLRELVLYFFRFGALGFGGPIALVGYMQRDLMEDWRGGERNYRPQRVETDSENAWYGLPTVGPVCRIGYHNRLDTVGNCVAFPSVRSHRDVCESPTLVDMTTVAIAVISLVALLGFKKIPEPILILGAGIAGIVLHRGG